MPAPMAANPVPRIVSNSPAQWIGPVEANNSRDGNDQDHCRQPDLGKLKVVLADHASEAL